MKILVCGGRDYNDYHTLSATLDKYHVATHIIHGAAKGADSLAHEWAIGNGIQAVSCPAMWDYYGKSAGIRRNRAMLSLLSKADGDFVVAFKGGRGTAMMMEFAKEAGFDVEQVPE